MLKGATTKLRNAQASSATIRMKRTRLHALSPDFSSAASTVVGEPRRMGGQRIAPLVSIRRGPVKGG
jgi:hypothetical protein